MLGGEIDGWMNRKMHFGSCMIESVVVRLYRPSRCSCPDRSVTLSSPAGGRHASDTGWSLKGLSEDVQIIILSQSIWMYTGYPLLSSCEPTNLGVFSPYTISSSVIVFCSDRPQCGEIVFYTHLQWVCNDNCIIYSSWLSPFVENKKCLAVFCFVSLCCNMISSPK